LVKTTLSRCWFDKIKCKDGLISLENYKKKWNSSIGGWSSEDEHDEYSHASDAFRYLCAGLKKVQGNNSLEDDYKALRSYWGWGG
jgi:hypothetical protein